MKFDNISFNFHGGLARVKKDGSWGYIDKSGTLVIPCEYDFATPFRNGRGTVEKDGKLASIDRSGTCHGWEHICIKLSEDSHEQ